MGYYLSWNVTREDIGWSFLSFIGFVLSFWIIEKAKTMSSIKKKPPLLYILLNPFIATISPIIIVYIAIENSIGVGSLPIYFSLVIGIIVYASLYLHIMINNWKTLPNQLDSLKLTHDLIWRLIHIMLWILTILVISGYYVLYTESIAFLEEALRLTSPSFGKLSIAFALPEIFLLTGFWFGVISPLLGYAFTIPRRVAILEGKLERK